MPRIRIKDLKPSQGNRKHYLWNQLMKLNLLVYQLQVPNRNSMVVISTEEVIENLLSTKVKSKLSAEGFEVITPPEYQANRTFVLRNIDSLITEIDSATLKEDLEERNSWLKVTEIIKIPTAPRILKIKVESAEIVRLATEKGVLIYNQSVPPTNIEKETFVKLDICYRCYSYQHRTTQCPTPNMVVCSECADNTHTYRECNSNRKKCINCGGDHRTFAARCPTRKKLIQERGREIRERSRSRSKSRNQAGTYAQAAAGSPPTMGNITSHLSREDQVKIASSIEYAFRVEGILPGTFHETVAEMYELNGLPKVKFPKYVPPPNIDPDKVQEEIEKMRKSRETTKNRETPVDEREPEEEQTLMEAEPQSRKRDRLSPKEQQTQPPTKARRDDREDKGKTSFKPPRPPTPISQSRGGLSVPPPREEELDNDIFREPQRKPIDSSPVDSEIDKRKIKYLKHMHEMQFCIVKPIHMVIQKGDSEEMSRLIKENRVKYAFHNPAYDEEDCKKIAESGFVELDRVILQNVSSDAFNVFRSGRLIRERRLSK